MISRHYKTEPIKENPHKVEVRQMYDDSSAQVIHISLKPGESLKPHRTPVDVVFYILEGTAIIHIGNESVEFEKDSLIESPTNITHFISNESNTIVRFLVIKAPRPENTTRLL